MTTQTSAPIGSTGQSLEGVAVSTAAGANLFRESVVLADPNDPIGYGQIVSNQPASTATPYGATVWVAGTPARGWALDPTLDGINAIGTLSHNSSIPVANSNLGVLPALAASADPAFVNNRQVLLSVDLTGRLRTVAGSTTLVQVVSSIPYLVAQSTSPWTVGGTVSSQIVSSLPILVAQSTSPWTVGGTVSSQITSSIPIIVALTSTATAVISTWPLNTTQVNLVSSIPLIVSLSSTATAVVSTWPLNTTQVNIVSSLPINVSQSTSPWVNVISSQIARGNSVTSWTLANTLNTTVIKASQGNLYSYSISNIGSTNVFIRFYDTSTAALTIASTAAKFIVGVSASTANMPLQSRELMFADLGITFTSGISIITQQQAWTATNAVGPGSSSCVLSVSYF